MLVSEAGEFALIEMLCRELGLPYPPQPRQAPRAGFLVDIGDDALVTEPGRAATAWTTDTLVEGVHFLPDKTPWRSTGWKAIAINVSDIAAIGALPASALVTLSLPPHFRVEDALELYRGLKECCDKYGVQVGGGDIVRSPVFSVTVAMSGTVPKDADGLSRLLQRSAACLGDAIAVSGTLGDSAAGLRLLQESANRDSPAHARLIDAHERPRPCPSTARRAAMAGIECGMDVSDGLVQDAGHIARASRVGLRIDAASMPLSADLRATFPEQALDLALTGGEDYQLLLCGRRQAFQALIAEGLTLTIIGEVLPGEPRVVVALEDGGERAHEVGGWDHFRDGGAR